MEYRVTALKAVTIRAFVRGKKAVRLGDMVASRPTEEQQFVALRAGEVKEGLGLVLGVHPSSAPSQIPMSVHGVSYVSSGAWSDADLPKEFFGLYRLETIGPKGDGGVQTIG